MMFKLPGSYLMGTASQARARPCGVNSSSSSSSSSSNSSSSSSTSTDDAQEGEMISVSNIQHPNICSNVRRVCVCIYIYVV